MDAAGAAPPGPAAPAPPQAATAAPTGRAAGTESWRVELDNGDIVPLDGPLILGRNPSAAAGERAVPIDDATRRISKTHARLDVSDGEVLVTDVHSTNGVVILADGARVTCDPGRPTLVPVGATVQFGERTLRIQRTPR